MNTKDTNDRNSNHVYHNPAFNNRYGGDDHEFEHRGSEVPVVILEDDEEDDVDKSWAANRCRGFLGDVSINGCRYLSDPHDNRWRQFIWVILILLATAGFLVLVGYNVISLISHGTNINMEVNILPSVPFPAVTICNLNFHKMTSLFDNSLYDVVIEEKLETLSRGVELAADGCEDKYIFKGVTCGNPIEQRNDLQIVTRVDRLVCRHLCSNLYSQGCIGFYYNSNSTLCAIGLFDVSEVEFKATCSDKYEQYEYQERIRCLQPTTMYCGFDVHCHVYDFAEPEGDSRYSSWTVTKASWQLETFRPRVDNSYYNREGKYLLLHNQGYTDGEIKGRIRTGYINASETCISFAYNGYAPSGKEPGRKVDIKVSVADELGQETIVGSIRADLDSEAENVFGPDWYEHASELPGGILTVIVEGTVNGRGSVVMIDDLAINPCDDTYHECFYSKSGSGYFGKQNQTKSGHPCIQWSQFGFLEERQLVEPEMENFCRYLPVSSDLSGPDIDAPYCLIADDFESYTVEECDIRRCDCLPGYFRCSNGFCVSQTFVCDGKPECPNGEDELQACESSRRSLECDFSDDYICGYRRNPDMMWLVSPGPDTIPINPFSGRYLYVNPTSLDYYQKTALYTPIVKITEETEVRFTYYAYDTAFYISFYDHNNMYTTGDTIGKTTEIFDNGPQNRHWQEGYLCIPRGEYGLVFTMIRQPSTFDFNQKFAIGNIRLTTPCNQEAAIVKEPEYDWKSLECDFAHGEFCLYHNKSSNQWGRYEFISDISNSDGNPTVLTATLSYPYSYSHTISLISPKIIVDPHMTDLCMILTVKCQGTLRVYLDKYTSDDSSVVKSSRTLKVLLTETNMVDYDRLLVDMTDDLSEKSTVVVKIVAEASTGSFQLSSIAKIEVVQTKCINTGPQLEGLSCDFINDMCGYFDTSTNRQPWVRRRDEKGDYISAVISSNYLGVSRVQSPRIPEAEAGTCLSLEYEVVGENVNDTLDVTLVVEKLSGEQEPYYQYLPWLTSTTFQLPTGVVGISIRLNVIFQLDSYQEVKIRSIKLYKGDCKVPTSQKRNRMSGKRHSSTTPSSSLPTSLTTKSRNLPKEYDLKQFLLNEYGTISTYMVEWENGPNQTNLILGCSWENKPCNPSDLTDTLTDSGRCFTFNNVPRKQLETSNTGTMNGLSLTLNVGSYEKVYSNSFETGLKYLLHNPGDATYVQYMGEVIEPGTHSLGRIFTSESHMLGGVFSICADRELEMYPPPYTGSKCYMDCESRNAMQKCDCRAWYMVGNVSYCSYNRYFECVYGSDLSLGCDCPEACDSIVSTVTVSSTRLDFHNISQIIDPGLVPAIRNDQTYANNLRNRLEPNQFKHTTETLKDLIEIQNRIIQSLEWNFKSIWLTQGDVELTQRQIIDIVSQDINTGLESPLRDIAEKKRAYDLYLKPLIGYLMGRLDELSFSVIQIRLAAQNNRVDPSIQLTLLHTVGVIKESLSAIERLLESDDIPYLPFRLNVGGGPEGFENNTMDMHCRQLILNISDVSSQIASSLVTGYRLSDLKAKIHDVLVMTNFLKEARCFLQYDELCRNVTQLIRGFLMMKEDSFVTPVISIDTAKFLGIESSYLNELSDLYMKFKKANITTVELKDEINHLIIEKSSTEAYFQELNNYINDLTNKATNYVQTTFHDVTRMYMDAMRYAVAMEGHFPDSNMTARVRNMKMWRKPEIFMFHEADAVYSVDSKELWRVWPESQTLNDFLAFSAKWSLGLSVEHLLRPAREATDAAKVQINELVTLKTQLSQRLIHFNGELLDFVDDMAIDKAFVSDNIIKLDFYFGEKKMEIITQSEAYTIANFFSDFGGNAGLFLGISVMTFAELVDFVILCCIGAGGQKRKRDKLKLRKRKMSEADVTETRI